LSETHPLYQAILSGHVNDAVEATDRLLQQGAPPKEILDRHILAGLEEIGQKFEKNEIFVPELLISSRAAKAALARIQPLLVSQGVKPRGTVVIGTVKGDLHDIGKNLVASLLSGSGFEVVDLGVNVAPEGFLAAAQDHRADIVALSALLTTTMPAMKATIDTLENAQMRQKTKVIIGGAPVTEGYAREIGADGFGSDAHSAVAVARNLVDGHGLRG
jgi:5-methyltetrahydrofolate--homocysteine methyltransferase